MKHVTSLITHRGTKVDMVEQADGTIACYMDDEIQSSESDEALYHEALVTPVMEAAKKRERVMIIGGGEGATAREVLAWSDVQCVDMYEWDKDVVHLFQTKYPQWAKGAWNDTRLHLHYEDIFEAIHRPPTEADRYDIMIIDLFDPSEENIMSWYDLLMNLHHWMQPDGCIVLYAGVHDTTSSISPIKRITDILDYHEQWQDIPVKLIPLQKRIQSYEVYIPCFGGNSAFLLLTPP
jgi:spermidine synthase